MLNYFPCLVKLVDWSGGWRLQREQQGKDRERKPALPWLKAPQERSDEEIEAVPAESVHPERKSTNHIKTDTPMIEYWTFSVATKNTEG